MCVCVLCIHVCMCACVCVSVCICACVCVSVCNACVCVFVCLCVVYTCVYVSVYTYMCVCEYLCRCVGLRCKSFVQMIVIRRDVSGRGGEIIHPASGFCFTLQNIYCLSKTNVFAFDKYRRKTDQNCTESIDSRVISSAHWVRCAFGNDLLGKGSKLSFERRHGQSSI